MKDVFDDELPCQLYENDEATRYLAKNLHMILKTRYTDIKEHYVREHLKLQIGEIVWIKLEDNFSDILTKNVNAKTFERLSESIFLNGFVGHEDKFTFSNYHRENISGNL